jgi:hypothetical protein
LLRLFILRGSLRSRLRMTEGALAFTYYGY